MTFSSFVALGDSFSEGLNDPAPGDDPDRFRGWADRLAEMLVVSPVGSPGLEYANLAVRGKLLAAITRLQVPRAVDLAPDLVTLCAGGNDCIRPTADPDELAAELDDAVQTLQAAGCTVMLANGFDTRMTPLLRALRGRVGVYNSNMWTIAQSRGALMLDLWGMRSIQDLRLWSDDRLHLTPAGHEMVAKRALAVLEGRTPDDDEVPPARPPRPLRQAVTEEAHWVREHLAPWVGRRLRGRSSGDGRSPKLPELTPVNPDR